MTASKPRTGARTISVVLVEDHRIVREGLRLLIDSHPGLAVVGEAKNGAEALPIVARERPSIVLLDLDLNGENGLDLIPELDALGTEARVIVLTGSRDRAVHRQCVYKGARGLVQKDLAGEVLVRALERVHAGDIWFDRALMSDALTDVLQQRAAKETDPDAERIASLTPREREVVSLVCEGLRNKQIAERLFISNTTVRHHLTSIFSKLGISDRLELVIFAYGHDLTKRPG